MKKHNPRKGVRGELHSKAKLNWEKVRYIRANPENMTQVELAKRFGVSNGSIAQVRLHMTWQEG